MKNRLVIYAGSLVLFLAPAAGAEGAGETPGRAPADSMGDNSSAASPGDNSPATGSPPVEARGDQSIAETGVQGEEPAEDSLERASSNADTRAGSDSLDIVPNPDTTAAVQAPVIGPPPPDSIRGRKLYQKKCARCHGLEGEGNGPAARRLDPRPRDFTLASFKLRSTPSGSLPTDADLFRTITQGIPGTGMPSWAGLPPAERWQLVYTIKSFSEFFDLMEPLPPMHIEGRAPETPEAILEGEKVYQRLDCWECHGFGGRGDGRSANTLKDDWGRQILPFDLTRGKKMKMGDEAADIGKVILTGLDGTPMPSYRESLSDDEVWYLAYFIRSLFMDQ